MPPSSQLTRTRVRGVSSLIAIHAGAAAVGAVALHPPVWYWPFTAWLPFAGDENTWLPCAGRETIGFGCDSFSTGGV